MTVQVRLLNQGDANELVTLRRSALLDSPSAFLASPDDDIASSEAAVLELLKPQAETVVFGAYGQRLIGMLGLYRAKQKKAAHKAHLWGMFVVSGFRQQGVAAQLLGTALDHARMLDGVFSVHLSVSHTAAAARRLYEKAGFETWGVEPDAIRFDGQSTSDHHMSLALKSGV